MKGATLKHQEARFGSNGFCTQGGYVLRSSNQEDVLKDSLDPLA